jgi:hypothetical protein
VSRTLDELVDSMKVNYRALTIKLTFAHRGDFAEAYEMLVGHPPVLSVNDVPGAADTDTDWSSEDMGR